MLDGLIVLEQVDVRLVMVTNDESPTRATGDCVVMKTALGS